ncbi:polysaccharide deacetylase family protein [Sediminibacterium soli]|uniref:polysaccharide deacetylase family protein n=1 Tax=Sediminibacterium soli TaxID=2698829 RepID=UPI00137A93FF|nr:polysaccharide deacetylase family protein [Sediminibacterium soli]NCI46441.1 polysaccharide deacetylase family protein [Sediminibacterium soli]
MTKSMVPVLCLFLSLHTAHAQTGGAWKGRTCAVALTYDDAIDIDLDIAAPALDSLGLKGTFYLIGSSPAVAKRIPEWRRIAAKGHELGNHTSFHPCDGRPAGRGFVRPDNDLSRYTLSRMTAETKFTNTLLHAIDGRTERTFAFPCGDKMIGDTPYYDAVKNDFIAARGVTGGLQTAKQVDLADIRCYSINGQNADYMIGLVKKAQQTGTLLVFLFHGVGGGHNLNVARGEHSKLIRYLKENEKTIWNATMVDIARFVKDGSKH